ncbi:nucleotide sugar dehydrogenase [Planktomarina temperata]|nr:nucleotide sugar dehydrogenase [Planktomarina temperata]MDB2459783.1 nucleotide sugar dehydrogenase [Planktomarina temperata]
MKIEKICILGLGYVGLPLATSLSAKYEVVAFDTSAKRISELKRCYDVNGEVPSGYLENCSANFTSEMKDLKKCNVFIVTVPTPVNEANIPDLDPLMAACRTVGKFLKLDDLVIFESTVYPGATEERCVPVLEEISGLSYKKDFNVGYSPERVNPGDVANSLQNVNKLISASNVSSVEVLKVIYGSVTSAKLVVCSTIKVAEAAKIMENTQRDVNIALMNQFYQMLDPLGIDCHEVISAASTKWNFHAYKPGLVGGHCISVDPYYMIYRAKLAGINSDLLNTARHINENMSVYIADKIYKKLQSDEKCTSRNKILILGATFKENCSDFRNSKILDVYGALITLGIEVKIYDPWIDKEEFKKCFNIEILENINEHFDAAALLVPHSNFDTNFWLSTITKCKFKFIFDLKNRLTTTISDVEIVK